jgi:hypothetical protein
VNQNLKAPINPFALPRNPSFMLPTELNPGVWIPPQVIVACEHLTIVVAGIFETGSWTPIS